ncbi:chemotaxis protein CheB [Rubrobacter aplysinae]|uniref:chemotaxis protein CheB n=1 Tax=Rubrobacter aplysinae TaxID=909625 RepID=UPI00064B8202|nr:chemotaxis protein CheB [Rubrobacter aplysinae]
MAESTESAEFIDSGDFSYLVVIGSSAGGIEALSRVLGSLPEDFPAPVVIAQHMHPERESHLEDLLARQSRLPVETVQDHTPLSAGTVFVVPADRHANVTDREIEVHEDGHGRPKPSIDLLLTSAAEVYGENLVAVILSGSGSDGTDGARAVKRSGGTVVVQDPESAEFSGMPASLAPSTVDIVSDLDGIGGLLSDLLSESRLAESADSGARKDEESEFTEFLEELRRSRGIDFSEYKRPTIRRRLARRFTATGVGSLGEYRRYLEENPGEYASLINTFLIKVTEFFRDPEQFEYLRSEVLPGLIEEARESGEQLRLWSAGCATGEEAYSLAILVSEALEQTLEETSGQSPASVSQPPDVRIFATDLDGGAVDHARRGVYPASALSALTGEQVSRYFDQLDGLYYVKQFVRSMLIFGEHDLAQRSPFPRLDLVVSRNVLIYFTPELQRRTLQLFAFSLKDRGYLMLGKAESTSPLPEYFASLDRQYKVFYRVGERFVMPASSMSEAMPSLPKRPAHGGRSLRAPQRRPQAQSGDGEPSGSAAQAGERALAPLPVGVISVDNSYDIHAINPAARRLLSVHGSAIGEDLLHLVREAPYEELRTAIDYAFREGQPASTGEFEVEEVTTGESRTLDMTCHPPGTGSPGVPKDAGAADTAYNQETVAPGQTVIILIEDVTHYARSRRELRQRLDSAETELAEYRQRAEQESGRQREQNGRLVEGNRQLEASNRELRRAVEELRAANEQYQLSTEEAQASSEEVETLNEELQATNEELETVNEELQATVEELNTTNEDLQNRSAELQEISREREREQKRMRTQLQKQVQTVLESVSEPMLVVESSGRATLTNEAYRHTFGAKGCVATDDSGSELPGEETPQSRATRGESFTATLMSACDDGTRRRFEARGEPVGDDEQRGGLVVFRELPDHEDHDPDGTRQE